MMTMLFCARLRAARDKRCGCHTRAYTIIITSDCPTLSPSPQPHQSRRDVAASNKINDVRCVASRRRPKWSVLSAWQHNYVYERANVRFCFWNRSLVYMCIYIIYIQFFVCDLCDGSDFSAGLIALYKIFFLSWWRRRV